MGQFVSTENSSGFFRIVLREDSPDVGVYVEVYESADSAAPERDHLEDTFALAKERCREEFGLLIK
ncbi:MAG: hypothetical protein AAF441_29615 [Pseudomonadota bacterium]